MTYDDLGEFRRQTETHYRLGMRGGWTQGAIWTRRILIVLCVLYVIVLMVSARFPSFAPIIGGLYLTPSQIPSGYLWQFLTAPFMIVPCWYQAVFHLLYLLTFGPKVEREFGNAKFLRFYLIIAIASTIMAFVLLYPTPFKAYPFSTASAAIFGCMVAYAFMWPRDAFYVMGLFPMPTAYIVLALSIVELVFFFTGDGQFAGSAVGIAIAFTMFKVPSLKAFILGEKKSKSKGTEISRKKEAYIEPHPTDDIPDTKSEKKGKRSKFLEL